MTVGFGQNSARRLADGGAGPGVFGYNPPTGRRFARNSAESCTVGWRRLAQGVPGRTIQGVVADLPQGSETIRLNRYPSPDGRQAISCLPLLFHYIPMTCENEWGSAECQLTSREQFPACRVGVIYNRNSSTFPERGDTSCDVYSNLRHPYGWFWRFRPVATRWASRLLSEVLRGPARRRCSMAISLPVRPWVPRETPSIAKPIPANAIKLTGAPGRRACERFTRPSAVTPPVAFFMPDAGIKSPAKMTKGI